MTVTLGELAVRFGCELRGDPAATVDSVAALSQAGPRSITFLANSKYVAQLAGTRAGAVILDAKSAADSPVPVLVVANPHATYARVATLLHPDPPLNPGVHPAATVAAGATIDPSRRDRGAGVRRRRRADRCALLHRSRHRHRARCRHR